MKPHPSPVKKKSEAALRSALGVWGSRTAARHSDSRIALCNDPKETHAQDKRWKTQQAHTPSAECQRRLGFSERESGRAFKPRLACCPIECLIGPDSAQLLIGPQTSRVPVSLSPVSPLRGQSWNASTRARSREKGLCCGDKKQVGGQKTSCVPVSPCSYIAFLSITRFRRRIIPRTVTANGTAAVGSGTGDSIRSVVMFRGDGESTSSFPPA